ncbi:MFS transporter [Rhodophyticola sp.]|uniref:MFS transporter n=1 Tax=Rhodophyticola sp. TaxID=2680032 RepID=UPI003D28FC32
MTNVAIPRPAQSQLPLYTLGFGNFVVGVGAFVVIGILSPVLRDLGLTEQEAGLLLTIYALTYAVASPVVVALTGRFDRRDVMLAGLAIFLAGTVLSAVSTGFAPLLAARVVTALGGALFTPVASSAAIGLVAPADRARALGIVFGGLTLAQVAGVPLGSYIGYTFGWQAAFWVVAGFGVAALPPLLRTVPRGIEVPPATLTALLQVLRNSGLMLAVSFTALFCAALYVVYTFMGPMLEARYALGANGITLFLVVFGVGAVIGNALGAALTRRLGSDRSLILLASGQIVLMPALMVLPLGLTAALGMTLVWSLCAWSFMVPQQARLVALAPHFQGLLLALNASAIYVGASVGATLGGATLRVRSFAWLGPAAAMVAALALVSVLIARRASAAPSVTKATNSNQGEDA